MRRLRQPTVPGPARSGHAGCRVLHVIDGLQVGGAERVLVTLVRELRQPNVEHAILPLYDGGPLLALVPETCAVHRATGEPLHDLFGVAHRFRPDVLHSWMDDAAVMAASVSASLGIPHVHRIPNIPSAQYDVHPRSSRFLRSFRLALEQASVVCALSEASADDTARYFGITRPRVVHNGFPLASERPDVVDRKPPGTLLLTMVGRLAIEKGHRFLIEALPPIVQRHPNVRCWIVGTGPLERTLAQEIRRLRLDDVVRLLGRRADVSPILAQTDIFVLPSLYEGFCNALTEAMRAACCVVTSDLPVIARDVLADGNEAVVCRAGSATALRDAILGLLADPPRRAALGRAAKRSAERFAVGRMVDAFRQIYDEASGSVRRDAAA